MSGDPRTGAGGTERCDHKFIDSQHCLKCGWIPPGDFNEQLRQFAANPMPPIEVGDTVWTERGRQIKVKALRPVEPEWAQGATFAVVGSREAEALSVAIVRVKKANGTRWRRS